MPTLTSSAFERRHASTTTAVDLSIHARTHRVPSSALLAMSELASHRESSAGTESTARGLLVGLGLSLPFWFAVVLFIA